MLFLAITAIVSADSALLLNLVTRVSVFALFAVGVAAEQWFDPESSRVVAMLRSEPRES